MKAITQSEKDALLESANDLRILANVLDGAALAAPATLDVTSPVTLADLVPTGNLDKLPQIIRDNSPISDADLEALILRAKRDIQMHSRMDGLLENVTSLVRFANNTVLPLLL